MRDAGELSDRRILLTILHQLSVMEQTQEKLLDSVETLQVSHNEIKETTAEISRQAKPIIDKLETSPLLRMLGGK